MRLTPDSRAPAKADPSARALLLLFLLLLSLSSLLLLWWWLLLLLLLSLLLLLADVGPIWAQFCPCLGPRLAHVAHILA